MNLLDWLVGRIRSRQGLTGPRSHQAVLVLIDDQLAGFKMEWGPEIEEMQQQLNAIAGSHGGRLTGAEFLDRQHRLRYSVPDGRRAARSMAPVLAESAMGPAVQLYWRSSANAMWKRVTL
jgi:hypothetical protein